MKTTGPCHFANSTPRDPVVDLMKGITIFLVILGHIDSIPIKHWIFSFHMPLFFLIAGYFHKRAVSRDSIRKDIKRLIFPYLFTTGILLSYSVLVNCIFRLNMHQVGLTFWAVLFPTGTSFANPIPVWFLLALFWCKMVLGLLQLKIPNYTMVGFFAILAGIFFTFIKGYSSLEVPFAFMAGMSALSFYGAGFLFRRYYKEIPPVMFRTICVMLIAVWVLCYNYCSIDMMVLRYENYPLALLCAFGGTTAMYIVSRLILKVGGGKFLSWCGLNSLVILSAHTIERYLPLPYTMLLQYSSVWIVFVVKIVLCVAFTLLCYQFRFTRQVYSLKKNHESMFCY